MFFVLSKIFWFLAVPSNALFFILAVGVVLVLRGSWAGPFLTVAATLALAICGFSPLGAMAIDPLQERFPTYRPSDDAPVTGIILLGGAIEQTTTLKRGQISTNDGGDRMIGFADLARRYPQARLVFSGGAGMLVRGDTPSEADAVRASLPELGIEPSRVTYEDRSRNTQENAMFTRALIDPAPGERWLLVTSAYHMPRAVGCFRAAGFPVTAYPVDYRTEAPGDFGRGLPSLAGGLWMVDTAAREWVGLVAYYLSGRIADLFPAP